ncbi:MAG: transcriptional repressor [Thermoguttaceae bacterium]|jgi:Fur family ferric uptake transcriptional regulator
MPAHPFQRNTRQRQMILEELLRLESHPTASGLYDVVRRRLPRISLGTVYRNLELLAQAGAIRKLDMGGAEARFDGNVHPHDHVRCVECGQMADVAVAPIDLSDRGPHDFHGYQILGRRLEFLGICPSCRQQTGHNHPLEGERTC